LRLPAHDHEGTRKGRPYNNIGIFDYRLKLGVFGAGLGLPAHDHEGTRKGRPYNSIGIFDYRL